MRIKTCAMLTNIDKAVFPLICAWFMFTMVFKAYFASLSYFNKPDGIILPSESRIVYIQISDLKVSLLVLHAQDTKDSRTISFD